MIQKPFTTKINLRARDYIERRDDPDVSLLPVEYEKILKYVKFVDLSVEYNISKEYEPNGKWKFACEETPRMQCAVRFRGRWAPVVFMEMPDYLLDHYLIEPEPLFGDHFLKAKFGKNSYNPFNFLSVGMGFCQIMTEKESRAYRSSVAQYNKTHDEKLIVRAQPSEKECYYRSYYVFRYQ